MKIAIVAPCPTPYTVGGAEKMWWGLQREINTKTTHQAEIIKLPTKEHGFWDLIDSYEAFSRLDLSAFDLIISGKYPAWMVSHPRHLCYMQHRLRGLYDCYHYNKLPPRFETNHPELRELQQLLEQPPQRAALEEVFSRLRGLRYRDDLPDDAFRFPGSFIKQVVEYLDGVGLHPDAIESYYAISRTVANRADYFPKGADVRVVYPPSNLEDLRGGGYNYFFTASRLDAPKRIDLLVEAMKFVGSQIELRIAGEGPDRPRLEAAAKDDPRIKFLGFRSDVELVNDYANARAVAFLPQDEDYGLITIEAMMSGKPVITTTDAGGPTEFVESERTGFSVEPSAEALAAALNHFVGNPTSASRMGELARERVRGITWPAAVEDLLGASTSTRRRRSATRIRPRKLTVATTFGIIPVRGGGQARIFNFYKNLAPIFQVDLVTLGPGHEAPRTTELAPGMREIRIPKSPAHTEAENKISAEVDWFSVTDVVFPELHHLTPAYAEAFERSARDAEAVVASHPYGLPVIEEVTDKPLWYEAQDVEYLLKKNVIPETPTGLRLVDGVRTLEQRCCAKATLLLACCSEDRAELTGLYGVAPEKTRIVPNGIDVSQTAFISRSQAAERKRELGLSDDFLALFIGSWHPPNLDAVEQIMLLAEEHRSVQFLILGSSGGAFQGRAKPANLGFFSAVDDELKALILSAADLALNPMRNGSGTNLKMLEYAASGLPILSTRIGLRGLDFQPDKEVFAATLADFSPALERVRATDPQALQEMTWRARQRAEAQFDWRKISERFLAEIPTMH